MATVELEYEEGARIITHLRENSDIDFSRCKPSELVSATERVLERYCRLMIEDMDQIEREIADQIHADRILGSVRIYR